MEILYKRGICYIRMFSFVLTKWYQLSPICAADGPPFLSRKELRSARFPCVSFSVLKFYKRIFLFTPAICKDCTVPRIRSGFLPTQESVYMLNSLLNLHQALEQTGETTRACRFCLQVLNFLQTEGRSAFYRKFLRISSIKKLWAMTRRH